MDDLKETSISTILPRLSDLPTLLRLRWTFRFVEEFHAPRYLGSALRGLLGHGLRKTACVTRKPVCGGCVLVDSCIYTQTFEPSARSDSNSRVPLVLAVPLTAGRTIPQGGKLCIEMTLQGDTSQSLPYLVRAFELAGRRGLNPNNTRFELTEVSSLSAFGNGDWHAIYSGRELELPGPTSIPKIPQASDRIRLDWMTPLRLKRKGHLIGAKEFNGSILLNALLYRYFDLVDERPDQSTLAATCGLDPLVGNQLYWRDWTRYSSRQKTRMQIGGLLGHLAIDSSHLAEWWPLLWMGQWLHLGKFTSIGLGRYRLSDASLPEAATRPLSCILEDDGAAQKGATESERTHPIPDHSAANTDD